MAVFNVTEASSYIGKFVRLDLKFSDDTEAVYCVHVVGFVSHVPGVYEQPHFLAVLDEQLLQYPEEFFWSTISSICVLETTKPRI